MFQVLFVHLQEALHKQHLAYCVRVMSVGCTRIRVVKSIGLPNTLQHHDKVTNLIHFHFQISLLCLNPLHISGVCWVRGFISGRGHGCFSLVFVYVL
jgi:hypothetical protein